MDSTDAFSWYVIYLIIIDVVGLVFKQCQRPFEMENEFDCDNIPNHDLIKYAQPAKCEN